MGWKKPAAIGGGVVLFLGILAASLAGGGSSGRGEPVQVEAAANRTVVARVKATGEITSVKKVAISTKVMGEIVSLPVHEGSDVKVGDVLVQIDPKQFASARDQASSALSQSQVAIRRLELQMAVGKKNLEREEELRKKGYGSETDLESAQVAYSSAQVELEAQRDAVEQSQSSLQRAKDDLERTTIRSPINGRVIELDTAQGETAIPGTMNLAGSQLMTVADMGHLVAEVEVGETDVVHLAIGQTAQIVVDALGEKPLSGKVSEIGSAGRKDPGTGVVKFRVKVALDNPDPVLHPSMTAKVNILTAEHPEVLTVPIQAVVKRRLDDKGAELDEEKDKVAYAAADDQEVVYLLVDGKARIARVKTGVSDEVHAEIENGLTKGQPVIVGPYRTLKELHDGTAVRAEEDKKASPTATASPAG